MNKNSQINMLKEWCSNPHIKSGIYSLDTDLNDCEIKECICAISKISYYNEKLIQYCNEPVIELFAIGLSARIECPELLALKRLYLSKEKSSRIILYELLIQTFKYLSIREVTILHLTGDFDFSILSKDELAMLDGTIDHINKKVIIICKSNIENNYIQSVSLKKIINTMDRRFKKVHITYKHDENYDSVINSICTGMAENDIDFSIDQYDLMYRMSIKEYEKEIGKSDVVILFVIPSYLTSIHCMFEMTEIFRNGNIKERLYPIIDLGDSIKRNGDGLKQIKDYWQNEKNRKAAQMTDEPGGSKYLIEEITIIDSIIRNLDDFWVYITNTNTGSLKTLTENNAHVLIQELKKIPIENKITSVLADDNVIQLEDAPQISKKIIQQHGEKSIVIENFTGTLNVN